MDTAFIKGVVVPILTPIDGEERIDEARFRRQIDYVIGGRSEERRVGKEC